MCSRASNTAPAPLARAAAANGNEAAEWSACHRVYLEPFELALHPVSCGEVIAFIEDGGYRRAELWLSTSWEALLYWQSIPGGARSSSSQGRHWQTFTLRGLVDISPESTAVHVSHYEADAIARWLGARLPTEFEWEPGARQVTVEVNLLKSRLFHPAVAPATPRDLG